MKNFFVDVKLENGAVHHVTVASKNKVSALQKIVNLCREDLEQDAEIESISFRKEEWKEND